MKKAYQRKEKRYNKQIHKEQKRRLQSRSVKTKKKVGEWNEEQEREKYEWKWQHIFQRNGDDEMALELFLKPKSGRPMFYNHDWRTILLIPTPVYDECPVPIKEPTRERTIAWQDMTKASCNNV